VVRVVMIIGVLAFMGFFVWAILPGYNSLLDIMNSTALTNLTGMTPLEFAEWRLMPIVIPIIIIVAVIWHYLHRHGEGGEE